MAGEQALAVEVLTPEGEIFSGDVKQVSTRTVGGEIGILANHVPILAALEPAELRLHLSDTETRRYAQAHGWLQVFGNKALILVEEAVPPENLDPESLKQDVGEAESRLAEAETGSGAETRARRDLQRAKAFLKLAAS